MRRKQAARRTQKKCAYCIGPCSPQAHKTYCKHRKSAGTEPCDCSRNAKLDGTAGQAGTQTQTQAQKNKAAQKFIENVTEYWEPPVESSQIELFLQALSGIHPRDPSAPGLVLSWLEQEQVFYASVVRYKSAFGQGKEVMLAAKGKTMKEVVNELAVQWLAKVDSVERLRKVTRLRVVEPVVEPEDWDEDF